MNPVVRLADRYAVVPHQHGPRVILGAVWTTVVAAASVAGAVAVALVLAATAGMAALQVAARWRDTGAVPNLSLAALGAVGLVAAAALNNLALGVVALVFVGVCLAFPTGFVRPEAWAFGEAVASVAPTLGSGLLVGLAGASAVQAQRVDLSTLLFILAATSMYDAGSYLCSGGARRRWVGPLWGDLGVASVTVAMVFVRPEPFTTSETVVVGALLAVACPAGGWLGSWLLPRARAHAPALRRLDSWLIAAPLVVVAAWMVG